MDTAASDTIESLSERIGHLVGERQELREAAADAETLELNRREIARLQHALSAALVRRFGPSPA